MGWDGDVGRGVGWNREEEEAADSTGSLVIHMMHRLLTADGMVGASLHRDRRKTFELGSCRPTDRPTDRIGELRRRNDDRCGIDGQQQTSICHCCCCVHCHFPLKL